MNTHTLALVLLLAACGGSTTEAAPPAPATPAAPVTPPPPTAQTAPPPAPAGDALKPGDPAPDVTFTLQDGKTVALSSLKGRKVLVYFYPKDETPGCTMEAESIRDGWPDIQAAGLQVFGVSTQDAASHQEFIEKHQLPFPLVVDTDHKIADAFHVPLILGSLASRQSFLVGPDGKIAQVWLDVDPKVHAAEIIAAGKS